MWRIIILGLVCVLTLEFSGFEGHAREKDGRPTIGLVLGGGGAKGLAHVGVIRVLEENRIPIDVISGTSMGAVVGSLYASGYSADEIEEIANTLDWEDVFNDDTARSRETFRRKAEEFGFLTDYKITFRNGKIILPEGLIQGQNLFLEISRLLARTRTVESFDKLPIPFRLVATDLETGEAVIIEQGDLATAVFGSMAIPGFIPPVEREGRRLLDGGLVNNVPVDLARNLGADIVIVVNVGSDAKKADEIDNFIDVLRQTQILLTQANTKTQMQTVSQRDVKILPQLDDLSISSFEQTPKMIEKGAEAANEMMVKMRPYALGHQAWAEHLLARVAKPQISPIIDEIRIVNASKLSDDIIRFGISQNTGEVFNSEQINTDIERLYGGGVFDRITYDIIAVDNRHILDVRARAKDSSDGYFKFGLALDSNLENESAFQLGMSYTKPQVNKWAGEWRTEIRVGDQIEAITEFYQPLGASQRFFVEPSLLLNRSKNKVFGENNVQQGEVKVLAYGAQLHGGANMGRWGEVRTGLTIAQTEIDFTDLTPDDFDTVSLQDSYWSLTGSVDTLDSLSFPTDGNLLIAVYEIHDRFLGGETKYENISMTGFKPITFGRHTFGGGLRLSGSGGDDATTLGARSLGGFLALSGFSEDELFGPVSAVVLGTYYYRLNRQAALFDAPIYVGGSVEAGNVYSSFDDFDVGEAIIAGSIFAGMKSPIGPVFVGVGTNDTGATSVYFSIGSFF